MIIFKIWILSLPLLWVVPKPQGLSTQPVDNESWNYWMPSCSLKLCSARLSFKSPSVVSTTPNTSWSFHTTPPLRSPLLVNLSLLCLGDKLEKYFPVEVSWIDSLVNNTNKHLIQQLIETWTCKRENGNGIENGQTVSHHITLIELLRLIVVRICVTTSPGSLLGPAGKTFIRHLREVACRTTSRQGNMHIIIIGHPIVPFEPSRPHTTFYAPTSFDPKLGMVGKCRSLLPALFLQPAEQIGQIELRCLSFHSHAVCKLLEWCTNRLLGIPEQLLGLQQRLHRLQLVRIWRWT